MVVYFGTQVKWLAVVQENSAHGNGKGVLNHVSRFQASACVMCTDILLAKTKLGGGVEWELFCPSGQMLTSSSLQEEGHRQDFSG